MGKLQIIHTKSVTHATLLLLRGGAAFSDRGALVFCKFSAHKAVFFLGFSAIMEGIDRTRRLCSVCSFFAKL